MLSLDISIIHIYLALYEQVQQTLYCCGDCPYSAHTNWSPNATHCCLDLLWWNNNHKEQDMLVTEILPCFWLEEGVLITHIDEFPITLASFICHTS